MLKTILCDLGNVLLFFSHERMCRQIGELFGRTGDEIRQALFSSTLLREFETGRLGEPQFQQRLETLYGRQVKEADLRRAGSDIFTVNESLERVLDDQKSRGVRLVLLSNTSHAHIQWVRQNYRVLDRFDELVLSYESGFVKPEDGIFLAALQAIHCRPEECLYLDDIREFVAKGETFGLRGHVFTTTERFSDELRSMQGGE